MSSDKFDEMFVRDMNKLSQPSELALNAAKVKAAQDPEKKGAEKPDLYAKGKGKGKDGEESSEKNEERKSKGPNKGEKKDKIPPQFLSKKKCEKEASLSDRLLRGDPKSSLGKALRDEKLQKKMKGVSGPEGAKLLAKRMKKKAAPDIDTQFTNDLHQVVGLETPVDDPKWQRPDVSVEGQCEDRIDEHYLAWMRERAGDDVVKEASLKDEARKIPNPSIKNIAKALRNAQLKGAGKALGAAAALTAGGAAGYHLAKRKQDKTAGVIENPENLRLIERLRSKSEKLFDPKV